MTSKESSSSRRAGRWSPDSLINALERRYALLKGRYETIEQDAEHAVGAAEIIEVQDRIESDKVLMRRVMDAIVVVAQDVDPDWVPGHVKPIYPKARDNSTGRIAATAYQILRREKRPMSVRELAREAVTAHGLALEERHVARFDLAVRSSLDRRVGKDLGVEPGTPKRYFIGERASSRETNAGRSSDAASTPSIRETSGPDRQLAT